MILDVQVGNLKVQVQHFWTVFIRGIATKHWRKVRLTNLFDGEEMSSVLFLYFQPEVVEETIGQEVVHYKILYSQKKKPCWSKTSPRKLAGNLKVWRTLPTQKFWSISRGLSIAARAGRLGFAVLQCSSKSYSQAILNISYYSQYKLSKQIFLWARPIKITYLKSNSFNRKCQKVIFHFLKM